MRGLLLLLLIVLKAAVMALIILYGGIGLGPDEAQYWTWSRHMDWGYYSKPPAIAWQIFFGTALFGNTEFGVRFGALVIGAAFIFATYRLAILSGLSAKNALIAALLATLTPLGIFMSFLSITDGGMLIFWTLAFAELAKALQENKAPNYIRIGIYIALGALFKWPIYLFLLVAIISAFFLKNLRRPREMVVALFISFLGVAPTIYWNVSHDFVTFKHVWTIVKGGNEGGGAPNPLDFIASQMAIISPLVFALWLIGLLHIAKERKVLQLLGGSSLIILLVFVFYSCFKKGQGNWCLFAYPAAFVYLAEHWGKRKNGGKWIAGGIAISVFLTSFLLFLPTWQSQGFFPSYKIPWKVNVFKHNLGWDLLESELQKMAFDPTKEFLFGDKYQMSSLLSFYNPWKEQAFFLNLLGVRKNQFSFWPPPAEGKDGIFVVAENAPRLSEKMAHLKQFYKENLKIYFESVEPPLEVPLFWAYGEVEKSALIFRCKRYLGIMPQDPEKY